MEEDYEWLDETDKQKEHINNYLNGNEFLDGNMFYDESDFKVYKKINDKTPDEKDDDDDERNPFQIQRDRILFSEPFRRLQGKMQVFPVGEYDFYRTRLTHTLEVARIARSIVNRLNKTSASLNKLRYIDPVLVEAAAFAHDLGHPPFGHCGESMLNKLMERHGGFEGNAQTLRLVTHLIRDCKNSEGTGKCKKGISPSLALIDAILKYKDVGNIGNKKFIYKGQSEHLKEIAGVEDENFFRELLEDNENNLNDYQSPYRSIECQIMNWADDVAYSIYDIQDAINAGILTPYRIRKYLMDLLENPQDIFNDIKKKASLNIKEDTEAGKFAQKLKEEFKKDSEKDSEQDNENKKIDSSWFDNFKWVYEIMLGIKHGYAEHCCSKIVGYMIQKCELKRIEKDKEAKLPKKLRISNRYLYRLHIPEENRFLCELFKDIIKKLVYTQPEIQQLNHKYSRMIKKIFEVIEEQYINRYYKNKDPEYKILSNNAADRVKKERNIDKKYRLICDYIANMTDAYAMNLYERLFSAHHGSFRDIL